MYDVQTYCCRTQQAGHCDIQHYLYSTWGKHKCTVSSALGRSKPDDKLKLVVVEH